jgi:hypothetical protein
VVTTLATQSPTVSADPQQACLAASGMLT